MQGQKVTVYQYTHKGEFIQEHPSMSAAAESVGMATPTLNKAVKLHYLQAKGFIWVADHSHVPSVVKLLQLREDMSKKKEIVITLNELELELFVRMAKSYWFKLWDIKQKVLSTGEVQITLKKEKKNYYKRKKEKKYVALEGPYTWGEVEFEQRTMTKQKWYLVYEVNAPYRYALDFGYGDTWQEAVQDFHRSRRNSPLDHNVLIIDQNYEKVQRNLLSLKKTKKARMKNE